MGVPDGADILKQLLEAVERYLSGKGTLVEFEAWFVPVAWGIDASMGSLDSARSAGGRESPAAGRK